jgi:hypothetical protein
MTRQALLAPRRLPLEALCALVLLVLGAAACGSRGDGTVTSAESEAQRTRTRHPQDAGSPPVDSGVSDSGVGDSGVGDSGVGDSGVGDSGVGDSGVGDSGVGDSAVSDSGVSDSGVSDSGVGDSGVGDSGASDGSAGTTMAGIDSGTSVGAVTVGSHTMTYQSPGQGTSPMTTKGITTQQSGSSFVVCASIDTDYAVTVGISISDNMGNTYRQVGSNVLYASEQGTTSMYVCNNCAGGPNHTFSMKKQEGFTDYESTIFAIEVQGATTVDDYVQTNAESSPLTAGSVKTTKAGDALVMCAFAASYSAPDDYTPSAGYTLLDQQTFGTVAMAGASAAALAKAPGSYAGTMTSSLANSGAIFLISLSP